MALKNLEKKLKEKKVSKVSYHYLEDLCKKYYLTIPDNFRDYLKPVNGAYKGILSKIDNDYVLFEKLIKNYVLISRALTLLGKKVPCQQIFNIFNIKNNLSLFITAVSIIDRSRWDIDYIELKFKLEEGLELDERRTEE